MARPGGDSARRQGMPKGAPAGRAGRGGAPAQASAPSSSAAKASIASSRL